MAVPNDGTAGTTNAGDSGTTGTPAGTPATTPATGTPATGTPAVGTTAATTATPNGFTYAEDRSTWIPKHRFDQVSTKASRAAELETQLAAANQRVAALAGVTPQDPEAANAEQVREAIFKLFPQLKHLGNLSDEQMQRLIAAPDQAQAATQIEQREWARHGKAQMATVFGSVAEAIGADELTADQQSDLKESFTAWFRSKAQAELTASDGAQSATLQRYEDGDPKLLDEFVKRYTANWVEPARRKVTAQTLTRTRAVPNSAGRTQVTTVQKPATFKDLDERIAYGAALAKERGVQFAER